MSRVSPFAGIVAMFKSLCRVLVRAARFGGVLCGRTYEPNAQAQIYSRLHTRSRARIHAHARMHTYTGTRKRHTRTHIYTRTHAHIHRYAEKTHTHTHTHWRRLFYIQELSIVARVQLADISLPCGCRRPDLLVC